MKHFISLTGRLAAIALVAAVFVTASCKDDKGNEEEVIPATISIENIASSYPLDGGTYSFTVKCSTNWAAEVISNENNYLAELKTVSGEAGDGTKVMFTTYDAASAGEENLSGTAVVRISNPKNEFAAMDVTLKFTADPAGAKITIEGVEESYMMDGKTYSFTIKSNRAWKISAAGNEEGYITSIDPTESEGDLNGTAVQFVTYDAAADNKYNLSGTVVLTISSPSDEFVERYVELNLKSEDLVVELSVENVADQYMLDGKTYSFTIKSNRPWKISAVDNDNGYITSIDPTESVGAPNGTAVQFVTYDAKANNKYNISETVTLELTSPLGEFEKREIKLNLKSEELVASVSVDNVADYYIMDGSKGEFTLKSNLAWTARVDSGSGYITLDAVSGNPDENGAAIKFTTIDDSKQTPTGQNASAKIVFDFGAEGVNPLEVNIKLVSIAREANCYAVAPGSYLLIPVSRANDAEIQSVTGNSLIGAGDAVEAKLLWIDNQKVLDPASCVEKIEISGTGANALLIVKTGSSEGNALTGAVVSGDVKWSWHVWVVDDPGTIYDTSNSSHANSAGYDVTYERTWMDRNLGALAPASSSWTASQGDPTVGLYYQWGRKDPFEPYSAYDAQGQPIVLSINKDITPSLTDALNTYMVTYTKWEGSNGMASWVKGGAEKGVTSNAKTAFDPCPEGWRVPEIGITTDYPGSFGPSIFGKGGEVGSGVTNSWGSFSSSGRSFLASGQFFPATGYSNSSGVIEKFGETGYYFTSTRAKSSSSIYATYSTRSLAFTNANVRTNDGISVFVVASVRCVKDY